MNSLSWKYHGTNDRDIATPVKSFKSKDSKDHNGRNMKNLLRTWTVY